MAVELEQLSDAELRAKAENVGLSVRRGDTRASLIERVRHRLDVIDGISREELARILRWAKVEVRDYHTKSVLAQRFYHVSFRKTDGLSLEDLRTVAKMLGIDFDETTERDELTGRVQDHSRRWSEVFKRAGSKVMGFITRSIIGPDTEPKDRSLEDELSEGRVAGSIKRGAKAALKFAVDDYVREKLDEIEGRIDRKLEDIDRKMDEWRTKEIRHRLKIIRITIIATVIVAAISLIYTVIRKYGVS